MRSEITKYQKLAQSKFSENLFLFPRLTDPNFYMLLWSKLFRSHKPKISWFSRLLLGPGSGRGGGFWLPGGEVDVDSWAGLVGVGGRGLSEELEPCFHIT